MRTLLLTLTAALVASPAYAGKKKDAASKIRVGISTPIYLSVKSKAEAAGVSTDSTASGITLGTGGARIEGGYLINKNIEVGGNLGYSSGDMGDYLRVMAHGLYTKKVGSGLWGFGQALAGIEQYGSGSSAYTTKGGGLDLGLRKRFSGKASLDGGLEYMYMTYSDSVSGIAVKSSSNTIGLRIGASVRL